MANKMGELFMTFLLMIIALALTPTVGTSTATAAAASGITGTVAATLVALVPMFWVVIILAIGVAAVYVQLKGHL
jgi:tetrahydromethanopterin S-methyltransferase subunit D